jgi:nitroreductase
MSFAHEVTGETMLALIRARRSVREHTAAPLPLGILEQLLKAARWAPSGGNQQQWCFIAVRDPLRIRKIAAVSPGLLGQPATLVVLCVDRGTDSGRSQELDEACSLIETGLAAQNLMLAATAFGLGSCPVRSFNVAALSRLLALPELVRPELIVTLGYPARAVEAPPRRPAEETVHWEQYGERMRPEDA